MNPERYTTRDTVTRMGMMMSLEAMAMPWPGRGAFVKEEIS